MKRAILLFAAATVIPAMIAITSAQGKDSTLPPDGAALWRASCGYCHGGPMKAPELRGRNLPAAVIRQFARHGAPGMPPFHPSALSDEDLAVLARWIATQPAPAAADAS